jgi:dephospho-CoA kinase
MEMMIKEVRLIGLTGTNGAGKGEVAAYLIKKGYAYFSLSDIIREELEKKEQEITRDNLIKLGNELREKFGADILARRVMEKIKGKAVIDSIRNPKEIECLRKQKDFILLGIDAPVKLRYGRVKKRGRNESASTLREFIQKEREEMEGSEHGQQLLKCLQMADFRIINNGSLESLYQKLEEFL